MIANAGFPCRPLDEEPKSWFQESQIQESQTYSPPVDLPMTSWDGLSRILHGANIDNHHKNNNNIDNNIINNININTNPDTNDTIYYNTYNTYNNNNNNNNVNPYPIQSHQNATGCSYTALESASSPNFMNTSLPDVNARQRAGLDSTLYEGGRFPLSPWDSANSGFDFDDASFMASSVLANQCWEPDSSPEWSSYMTPNPGDSFYGTSFDSELSLLTTSPATVASQPPTLLDYPDLAISPVPSLTSSFSHTSSSCPGLCSPAAKTAVDSTTRQTPQRTRKQLARNSSRGRTPPAKTELRTHEDRILVACRSKGMSYKKIKEAHSFNVSESTLRGRHRALTKHSSLRPRKPRWTMKDIELLKEAVPLFTRQTGKTKVSWKGVSEYIYSQGGTHTFAYTTCRRKWCEVTGEVL
ncbi:hypothetical protein E4U43_003889 [Claviceps pusilla]|uniref:Myb-like domain-containing protein n=1 Tax=Claviceps pusilla TaxID=123648 RepID=A0A9P7N4L8_9HYPO|nr:hypothetical protein E4U43_003889 [Claviceps pusilla]